MTGYLKLLLLCLVCSGLQGMHAQPSIDLSRLKSNVIQLQGQSGEIQVKGNWSGDRLIIKGANNVTLNFPSATKIRSTHPEDALILEAPHKLSIKGNRKLFLNQSISVWGTAHQVLLEGIRIEGAHTGIRINQNQAYQHITIQNCQISNCQFEGIYLGPHYKSAKQLSHVTIKGNRINNCGWDGIQVGNCAQFDIADNRVTRCGTKGEWGQDFALTINPGSQGKIRNNKIKGKMQILDSRVFFE